MEIKDVADIGFDFADKKAYKQVIILMLSMIIVFGLVSYVFYKQHLLDDENLKTIQTKANDTKDRRIEKLEADNDLLRKDFRDVVNNRDPKLDTINQNVNKISKILKR